MRLAFVPLVVCALFATGACASRTGPQAPASATPEPAALAAVSPAAPQTRPPWFASVSPRGEAKDGSQIRVRFTDDLVPVEALESPGRDDVLAHFRLEPALPGRFELLTPRMVAFVADAPVPHATRVRVSVTAGLKDRAGHSLATDYRWSFTTAPLTLAGLPGADADGNPLPALGRRPVFGVDASDAVEPSSLLAHARLVAAGDSRAVALRIAPSPSPDPSAPATAATAASDATGAASADDSVRYDLVPERELDADTTYALQIDPGVAPLFGNVPTTARYEGRLRTFGPLLFRRVAFGGPGDGTRLHKGAPSLVFSNDLDPQSARGAVTLVPRPSADVPLLRVDEGGSIALDADALSPNTTYAVTIARTLADRFGQTLGRDVAASFSTGDLTPDIWAPSGLTIFPSRANLALELSTTNLPGAAYRSASRVISPAELVSSDVTSDDATGALLPAPAAWQAHPLAQRTNEELRTPLSVRSLLHARTGLLAYGFSARTVRAPDARGRLVWQEPQFVGAVQLTNVGVFAQWFPDGGFVRAHHLADGSPIAQARVDVYESLAGTKAAAPATVLPCASGTTAGDGTWHASAAAFADCASAPEGEGAAPALLAVVHEGSDWSFARSSAYGDGYDFGLGGQGWSAGTPASYGALVSDRNLYQPGETAKFLGIAYFDTNGTLARGGSKAYVVTATSPSGATRAVGSATVDAFGAFSVSLALERAAETGDWTLQAVGTRGERLDGSFRVAQFKPPNFKVDLTLSAAHALAGERVTATSTSDYLFGAPVEGGVSHVAVTRAREAFSPPAWPAFSFGRIWSYPENEPSVTSDVVQRDLTLDARGVASLPVPVATDLPYPMRYTVSAQTTDVSHLAVADTKSFLALPGPESIGLRGSFVATAGTPLSIDAVVTDAAGTALAGRQLELVLQQRVVASATQIVEGSEVAHEAVRYVEIARQRVASQTAPQSVSFTAPTPGEYRVRGAFVGASAENTATDLALWVTGPGDAAWTSANDRTLTIKLDKTTYRPGDTATALIESPFADAESYVAVVRHGVLYARTRIVHGGAPRVAFRVTPDMLPNAAFEVVLVRRGATARGSTLSRIGFAPFDVTLDAKYVKVDVRPRAATLEPAARQHLELRLAGRDGRPVRGEIALAVVNDAILQLGNYRFPDLVKTVYAEQPISTRFADNRGDVKLESVRRPVEKGFGFGGGAMAGPAGTRVRHAFVPLAYWNASVRTGADGRAGVDFTLPDDLTTWRVMALALTTDARFGNGEATFVASKPLATNPVIPQFARPADRFAAGVSVTNVARATGELDIAGTLRGAASFATGDPRAVHTQAPAGTATQAYRFEVIAGGAGAADVTFGTSLGTARDAFTATIPILARDALESSVTAGTTNSAASVPLDVAPSLQGPAGGLDVTLASTLLAEVREPELALSSAAEPFATTLASRIAITSDALLLARVYAAHGDGVPARSVATDLSALRALVLPDGGFAAWPGAGRSDLYETAFALQQLVQARDAGFDVAADLARGKRYLHAALANPIDAGACTKGDAACLAAARLEATETLGALGDARSDFVSDILAQERMFGYYERVELARFLLRLPTWKARGLALRDELFAQVSLGARRATVDVRGEFGESEVAGQAQMLGLALASGMPAADVDRLLTSLLGLRRNGRWGCVCDDAEAMNALVSYAREPARPPAFDALAVVPALPPRTQRAEFHGYTVTTQTASVPLDALRKGPSVVALSKTGFGTLHYLVALRYALPAFSPGTYAGLRIDRILRPVGSATPLATLGLALPEVPVTVVVARVYDIEDRIVTDHPVSGVVIADPLPAGFEAVDQTFRTAVPPGPDGGDTWLLDYQAIYRDRVLSFAHRLDAGSYAMHYLVRSVTPGTFAWPGATVSLQYAPEEFGRTAAARLVVRAR